LNRKYLNLPVKQDVFQELVEKVEVILDGYERILSKSRYLGGDVSAFHSFQNQCLTNARN